MVEGSRRASKAMGFLRMIWGSSGEFWTYILCSFMCRRVKLKKTLSSIKDSQVATMVG